MENHHIESIIARFLANDATKAEATALKNWRESTEENEALFQELKATWELGAQLEVAVPDASKAHEAFIQTLSQRKQQGWSMLGMSRSAWIGIAAGVAALFVVLVMQNNVRQTTQLEYIAGNTAQTVTLPDASVVTLRANSIIKLAPDFAQNRTLQLHGAAFFDVQRDESHPFTVMAGESFTHVLGTSFSIDARTQVVQLEVTSGRVAFGSLIQPEQVICTKSEAALLADGTATKLLEPMPNSQSWRTHQFTFDHTALTDVVATLSDYFQQPIVLGNPALANCRISAQFETEELDEILEVLEAALEITHTTTNNTITLHGKGCE